MQVNAVPPESTDDFKNYLINSEEGIMNTKLQLVAQ